jgi:thioesterase domain-containing protein
MAVRLFAHIDQEFGQTLPLLLLFKDGTVETIAELLTSEAKLIPLNGIVPIQPDGDELPLFILSAGLYMREMAYAMGTSRPVYGLHSHEEGQLVYRESVKETARVFYQRLIDFYPEGPYLLFGHSANGYFAIELARLLRNKGKTVAFLGLLDTYPPGPRRRANIIDRVKIHLNNLQDKNLFQILDYLRLSTSRYFTRLRNRSTLDEKTVKRLIQKGQVKEVRKYILQTYKPEPYTGSVILFSATHRPWYMNWDPMEQWTNFITGQLDIVPIPGDHMTVLKPPQVALLAEKINAFLNKIEIE